MANSSDEEISTDDSIDLNPLWRASAFLSDSLTEEDETQTTPDNKNAAGPPYVLELTPITDLASEHDNSTNTVETSTASADMEADPLNLSLIPPITPWMPATECSFFGLPVFPTSILDVAPRSLLQFNPITASASAQDNSTNTAEPTMTLADMRARRRRQTEELNVPLRRRGSSWMPAAANRFYGQRVSPIPVQNVAPLRRHRRRVPDQFQAVDILAPPKDPNDEVEVKAPKPDPKFVLPSAIREREERENAEIAKAASNTRALGSEFVSELLRSSMTDRISRADSEKLSGGFGNNNEKK